MATKPCPFCGSEWTQVRYINNPFDKEHVYGGYRGECTVCGITTRAFRSIAEAEADWNTRPEITLEEVKEYCRPRCLEVVTIEFLKDLERRAGDEQRAEDQATCYGYNTRELLLFAEACRKQGIDEKDLKDFMHNIEAIIDLVRQELRESVARAVGDFMRKEELRDEQRDEET